MNEAPIIVESGAQPVAACVWLHGLGADGHDFVPVVSQLRLSRPVRFVFPHALVQPVSINGGLPMRAWFDIRTLKLNEAVDETGISVSAEAVADLARAQGLPVLLAGFSQGGLIALHAALHCLPDTLGVLALSTWYPLSVPASRLDVFMGHGTADEIVPLPLARSSAERLSEAGAQVDWHEWPMGHGVCPAEIEAVGAWINQRLETC